MTQILLLFSCIQGYCRPTAIQELRATIRVLPPKDWYISTLRNNIRSRAWGAAIGCSYRNERCCIVKKGGGTIDLEPCLTYSSTIEPTLAPVAVERTMTTRAADSRGSIIHLKYIEAEAGKDEQIKEADTWESNFY
ncbi:zinc finger CCCH domain protein [Trifolium repens]|nr:zinc finger CCCH domain protein [Trifolium repens]